MGSPAENALPIENPGELRPDSPTEWTPDERRLHWIDAFRPHLVGSELTGYGVELRLTSCREARGLIRRFVAAERRSCRALCYAVSPDNPDGTFFFLAIGPGDTGHLVRWLLGATVSRT